MLVLACLLGPQAASASKAYPPTELDAEAAFLTRLAPFVDWPSDAFSSPTSPLVICVLALDSVTKRLAKASGTQKDGKRPIRLHIVGATDTPGDCHILYLGAASESATEIARSVLHRPVLTVSCSNDAAYETAIVVFAIDHGRVRFDIDDATAANSRLAISSKLLALARNVNLPFPPR